jgi:ankyrin repeat protein
MVRLLMECGADPNLQDENGWTALHAAAIRKHKGVAQLLQDKTEDGARIVDWVRLLRARLLEVCFEQITALFRLYRV